MNISDSWMWRHPGALSGLLLSVLLGISTVGCSGTVDRQGSSPIRAYEATPDDVVAAVERTMTRLQYTIERYEESDDRHVIVAVYTDAFSRTGARARNPEYREVTVTVTPLGPRETQVRLQMPPTSGYQTAPNRERVQQFFRVLDDQGLSVSSR